MRRIDVFVSSKMNELAAERDAIAEALRNFDDPIYQLHPWVYEDDATARSASIHSTFLKALEDSSLYIGVFAKEYGQWTIDEYNHATGWGIDRHIYVKKMPEEQRDPQLRDFLAEIMDVRAGLAPVYFDTPEDLAQRIKTSLQVWLQERMVRRPGSFAALTAESPNDLLGRREPLMGREAELAEIMQRMTAGETVLIHGFGGMGKTRLAGEAAARWLQQPDSGYVLWQIVGDQSNSETLQALARGIKSFIEINAPDNQAQLQPIIKDLLTSEGALQLQLTRRLLREAGVGLVVLDDLWNKEERELEALLEMLPENARLLVTSRQRYSVTGKVYLRRLERTAALSLIRYHARDPRLTADPALEQLCTVLGDHPYALKLAGGMLEEDFTPTALLDQIDKRLKGREGLAKIGSALLKEVVETSLNVLYLSSRSGKLAYSLFFDLSAFFSPQVTPQLLNAYLRATHKPHDPDTMDNMRHLTRRGLVEQEQHRNGVTYYRLHEIAHRYGQGTVSPRYPDDMLEACQLFAQEQRANLNLIDVEIENLLGAVDIARERAQTAASYRTLLSGIVHELAQGPYLAARGFQALTGTLLEEAADAALSVKDYKTAHYLLSKLGNYYAFYADDIGTALATYQRARELADLFEPQAEARQRAAVVLSVMGIMQVRQGGAGDAFFDEAEQIARAADDAYALSHVYEQRGNQAALTGQIKPALALYEQGIPYAEQLSDPARYERLFPLLLNQGSMQEELGAQREALTTHRRLLRLARQADHHIHIAYSLHSIGQDYHALGRSRRAAQFLNQALACYRTLNLRAKVTELEAFMTAQGIPQTL